MVELVTRLPLCVGLLVAQPAVRLYRRGGAEAKGIDRGQGTSLVMCRVTVLRFLARLSGRRAA